MHVKNGVAYYGKDVDLLTVPELLDEIEHIKGVFEDYKELGQGVSTKEIVYYRKLRDKLSEINREALRL
jgi:hypothetical protein